MSTDDDDNKLPVPKNYSTRFQRGRSGKPRQRGKISKWIELRGFGFILPANSANQVFFHVSALLDSNIEPTGGDVVTYSISQRHDGRSKAVQIEIEDAS